MWRAADPLETGVHSFHRAPLYKKNCADQTELRFRAPPRIFYPPPPSTTMPVHATFTKNTPKMPDFQLFVAETSFPEKT